MGREFKWNMKVCSCSCVYDSAGVKNQQYHDAKSGFGQLQEKQVCLTLTKVNGKWCVYPAEDTAR